MHGDGAQLMPGMAAVEILPYVCIVAVEASVALILLALSILSSCSLSLFCL